MKFLASILLLAAYLRAGAQHYFTKEGAFMDTITETTASCPANRMYFYNVGGKYPRSSASLLQEAQSFMAKASHVYTGSGYITFRFVIDCEGHMRKKVQVIQTDALYKNYQFDKIQVDELFDFLQTLDKWKIAKPKNGNAYSYNEVMSFKIQDGKVVNIIP